MAVLPHVRLLVDDVPEVARFYVDHLGFVVRVGELDGAGPYIELVRDGVNLGIFAAGVMAAIVDDLRRGDADRGVLVLEVDDVDAAAERLRAAGVPLVGEPADRDAWYLRTAHVRDPAGNLVELNAPLAPR